MTREVFLQGMAILTQAFNLNAAEKTMEVWLMLLEDVDDQDFMEAITNIGRHKDEFFPNTNLAALVINQIEQQKKLNGDEAWQQVLKALSEVGRYGTPTFPENPAVEEAIKSVGWKALCDCENNKVSVIRAQFLKAYASCGERIKMNETKAMIASGPVKNLISGIGKNIPGKKPREIANR